MKKTARIISFILIFALALGVMVSCGEPKPEELVKNAAEKTAKTPYSVTMDIGFSTKDAKYREAFSSMSIEDAKISVNGEDFKCEMTMGTAGVEANVDYTAVAGTLYMKVAAKAAGQSSTVKQKATLDAIQRAEMFEELSAAPELTPEQFEKFEVTKDGDEYLISCEGITDMMSDEINDMIESMEESLGSGKVSISNIKYEVKIDDGKYDYIKLVCVYNITVLREQIKVTMTSTMDYDYDESVSIKAPTDADTYEEVDYEDISK